MAQSTSGISQTREQWLDRAIDLMRSEFQAAGSPLPENLAVSCSWPSGNPRTVIGECWVAEASSRGYVEVFISPVLDHVAGIQGVLVTLRHELVHAAGRRGHGKEFKALAVELGLSGPMTATVASPELLDFINWTLLPQLGKYPHGAITGRGEILVPPTEPGDKPIILRPDDRPKKQSARMLKAECPECGYTIRLSKRWAAVGLPSCPTDGAALALDGAGEANEGEGVHVLAPAAVRLT
jgi:hypothetical protein